MLFRIEGDPVHPFSEAVGVLQRVDEDDHSFDLVLARRDGSTIAVRASQIVKLKVIS